MVWNLIIGYYLSSGVWNFIVCFPHYFPDKFPICSTTILLDLAWVIPVLVTMAYIDLQPAITVQVGQ
jgi:hypothetical protein